MTRVGIINTFIDYHNTLGDNIPQSVYLLIALFTCVGLIFILLKKKNGWMLFAKMLLVEYVALLYCSTVIFRTYNPEQTHNFTPFWSYVEIYNGDYTVQLPEKVMNLVVFLPVGLLLGLGTRTIKWWQVLLAGCLISVSIETMQFFLKRGFAEFDDVFHNTIGCVVGYGVFRLFLKIFNLV